MGAGSVAVVLWAWLAPIGPPEQHLSATTKTLSVAARPDAFEAFPELSRFAVIWERDVRRRLFAPPPRSKPKPEPVEKQKKQRRPKPPPLRVKLLATAIGAQRSYAIFEENSRIRVRGVGQKVGGAAVVGIEPGRVILEHHGRQVARSVPTK